MAYIIGSDKGKDIAKNMKAGETYKCSDGSTWTKKSDGSVSVTTSSGEKFDNAYKPTIVSNATSNVSTGSKTQNASSGNLQYTSNTYTPANNAPNSYVGKGTYNDAGLPNSAVKAIATQKALYNQAIAAGDMDAANAAHAEAERIRAQYGNYSGGEDGSEYIPLEKPQQNNQYTQSSGGGAQSWVGSYVQSNPQPTYNSKYDPEIDRLLKEILSRDDFSYDAQNDPLYQQYSQMYQREGDRAMRETLAEAASGAGGMNTYAVTAAQQAANRYASQLNDKIPELYQLAYDMYLTDKESKVQDLGILQNADATQYNRYRDTMNDWRNDRSFAYGAYQDDVAQGNWQKTFDYNAMIDDRNFNYNDMWANKEWNANQDQIALKNSRYDTKQADTQVEYLISLGQMPSAELIAKSSWSQSDIDLAVADEKLDNIKNNISYVSDIITQGDGTIVGLGIGPVGKDILEQLILADGVVIDENGNYSWANGWNNANYKQRLAQYNSSHNQILGSFF